MNPHPRDAAPEHAQLLFKLPMLAFGTHCIYWIASTTHGPWIAFCETICVGSTACSKIKSGYWPRLTRLDFYGELFPFSSLLTLHSRRETLLDQTIPSFGALGRQQTRKQHERRSLPWEHREDRRHFKAGCR